MNQRWGLHGASGGRCEPAGRCGDSMRSSKAAGAGSDFTGRCRFCSHKRERHTMRGASVKDSTRQENKRGKHKLGLNITGRGGPRWVVEVVMGLVGGSGGIRLVTCCLKLLISIFRRRLLTQAVLQCSGFMRQCYAGVAVHSHIHMTHVVVVAVAGACGDEGRLANATSLLLA